MKFCVFFKFFLFCNIYTMLTDKQFQAINEWSVPIGKYKGKKFSEMSGDKDYCKWYLTILDSDKYKNNDKIKEYLLKVLN